VSQAGITKADKANYLELHGWEKLPRKLGAANRWSDPITALSYYTEDAYEICKRRVVNQVAQPKGRGR